MMAANGYIVVAPNRRGVPGFGSEWLEQISGDYGGQNMKDYFSAIDAVAAEPFVDENRLGATGASYGGFSVYWLAGNHDGQIGRASCRERVYGAGGAACVEREGVGASACMVSEWGWCAV